MATDTPIRRANSFPWCGRLIVLPTGKPLETERGPRMLENEFSIDFPAMPDSITLQRSAEYIVTPSPALPDGMHQYRGTSPLEIPFKFRLHSFDSHYCKEGALSLLRLAARLHALVLPLNPFGAEAILTEAYASAPLNERKFTDDAQQQLDAKLAQGGATIQSPKTYYSLFSPVTVRLEIIYISEDKPGIACNGYVKNVGVELFGPWLRGPDDAHNLPSAAEFSFTFIHRPSHGNNYNILSTERVQAQQAQAYAEWVKDHLYNTHALVRAAGYAGVMYQGFDTGQPESGQIQEAAEPVQRFSLQSTALPTGSPLYQIRPVGALPPYVPTNADANSQTNNPTATGIPGT